MYYHGTMDILLDSSAIIAVLMEEPEKEIVLELTKNAIIASPQVLDFEIGNALSKLYKRHILDENSAQAAFAIYKTMPVNLVSVNMKNAIGIFCKYSIYAYDAYYLDIAVRLKMPFLTFDAKMKSVAQDLGVIVLEA